MDDRHPELAGEVDALGPAGEHRLRAEVDLDAPDRPGQQLAAGAGRALEHQDLAARRGQVAGGGQPGDAAADHDGTAARLGHAPSLSPGRTEPAAGTGRRTPMRTTHLLAVSATALLLSLTACSGGSDGDSPEAATAMDGGAAGGSAGDMAESAPEAPADAAAASKDVGAARNAVDLTTQQALIKTGAVSLRSADVGKTRYDVQVLVDEQGGQVADDKTETDKSGEPLRARMVLRVPVDSFEDVMNALGSMETLASTSTSSEDVTTQLIDVEARIKAQQASVERVRQLLAQAQSIRDIMAIESELAQRQAELDSLAQQQAYLKDQTSMATVKVNIERKPDPKAPVTEGRRLRLPRRPRRRLGRPQDHGGGGRHRRRRPAAVRRGRAPGRRPGLAARASDAQVTGHRSESCA